MDDGTVRWAAKIRAVADDVNTHREKVVLLCDEPLGWYSADDAAVNDTPAHTARLFVEWAIRDATCRRVVTGYLPPDLPPAGWAGAPRVGDGRELLSSANGWADLGDDAVKFRDGLTEPIPDRSVWQMKLGVALSALIDADEAVRSSISDSSESALLGLLLDHLEREQAQKDLCRALTRLALARTELQYATLREFTSTLPPKKVSVLERCLCDWDHDRASLHPVARGELLRRARGSLRRGAPQAWQLSRKDRASVHDRLAAYYAHPDGAPLRDRWESLHHMLLGAGGEFGGSYESWVSAELLAEVGRTLSYEEHEHRGAVTIFQFAVRLDPTHAYSHHYLAFNLDWLAEEAENVEKHYQEAITLEPTHPWWWSRWISYLATRGRFRDAKSCWHRAIDALSVSEGLSPDWIYLSLHRWVARWLLHWAELDFAEEVLGSIPRRLTANDTSIQTLWDLLRALRQAERGVSVFPLSVPAKDWWSPSPHTDLPPSWEGRPLRSWLPARIESVDQDNAVAFLVAAKRPATAAGDPVYFEFDLTRDGFEQATSECQWGDLHEGTFIELGFYGDGNEVGRIGVHRNTGWHDPYLLPLVPPPDRWYQRAVEAAWAEMAEAD